MSAVNARYQAVVPTGRNIDRILEMHELPIGIFEGAHVVDLGSGNSDLQHDLAIRGVSAHVIGVDNNRETFASMTSHEHGGTPLFAELDHIPLPDNSADIVIANFSPPMWGSSSEQITGFFDEAKRITRAGCGIMSIHPLVVHGRKPLHEDIDKDADKVARRQAVTDAVQAIVQSSDWLPLGHRESTLTVRKVA